MILSCLRNAIMPKSCFRRLCHSNFVNTLLYIAIFGTIPRLHRHRNLPQFLFKQSSASICTTVPKISNKSLLELFFFGTSGENFCPFSCQSQKCRCKSCRYHPYSITESSATTKLRPPTHPQHTCGSVEPIFNVQASCKRSQAPFQFQFNTFFKNGKPIDANRFKNSKTTTHWHVDGQFRGLGYMVHSSVKKMGPTIHFWRRGVNYNVLLETTLVELLNGCSNCRLLEVDVQTCFRHAELF